MEQQAQTLDFFSKTATDWQRKSINADEKYSVIQGRNNAVLTELKALGKPARILDVGCGTGQLTIQADEMGATSEGIDFSKEMIDICETNKKQAKSNATFIHGSFYDVDFDMGAYDIISAQGFIEYVSPDEMAEFFQRCWEMLKPGGVLAVGSRNRMYNLFSLNDYSKIEMGLGTMEALFEEAMILNNSTSEEELFKNLKPLEMIQPQPESHPITGIGVEIRYQYSVSDLVHRLKQIKFTPKAVYPVHYHAMSPALKLEMPHLHSEFAKSIQATHTDDFRLVPFSSTFVLMMRK